MKIRFLQILLFGTLIIGNLNSAELYPGLTGKALLDQLVADYKPTTVLSYDNARDTIYGKIYKVDDSLTCVYSGYKIYLDPVVDPSTDAFNKNINCEHTWPQSKGAVNNAKSDMHHLFPVRDNVNSSRNNHPYAEIDDINTDTWFRNGSSSTSIPTTDIDEYAEKDNDNPSFEPREAHKGNAARAVLYFYTMYRSEAMDNDPDFFFLQKDILYDWHKNDLADALEISRGVQISTYQNDKQNPFILDSSLVKRAFFTAVSDPIERQNFSDISGNTADILWVPPASYLNDRNEIIILAQNGSAVDDDPTSFSTASLTADARFGFGTEIGSGSYVIYKGDARNVEMTSLAFNTTYHIKIWTVLDHSTWSDSPSSGSFTTQEVYDAQPGDLMVTEIMKDPGSVADADGEWFEIYNCSNYTIDLNGWYIKDGGSESHVIDPGGNLYLAANDFMVLGRNNSIAANGGVTLDYTYSSFQLANSADEIILLKPDGLTEIDRVEYFDGNGWPNPTGASMVFTGTADEDNNVSGNWDTASEVWPGSAGDLGSPGYAGSDQPLPITLISFTGRSVSDGILLSWQTASEIRNRGFEVYRKHIHNSDFEMVASYRFNNGLRGRGNSNETVTYRFLDKQVIEKDVYHYKIADVSYSGERQFSKTIFITHHSPDQTQQTPVFPDRFDLLPNYPNPFNTRTNLKYHIPALPKERVMITMKIVDVLGRPVRELVSDYHLPGIYKVSWDGKNSYGITVPSGAYYAVLQTEYFEDIIQMMLLK